MGQMKNARTIWVENLKGRNHLGEIDVDGKTILNWVFRKQHTKECHGLMWLNM